MATDDNEMDPVCKILFYRKFYKMCSSIDLLKSQHLSFNGKLKAL